MNKLNQLSIILCIVLSPLQSFENASAAATPSIEAAYDTARSSNTRVKKQQEDRHRRRVTLMAAATKTHHQRSLRSGKSIRGSSSKSSKSSAKSSKHSRDDHDGYNSYDTMDDYSMSGINDLNSDEIISNGVKEEEDYLDVDVGLIPAEVPLHITDKEEDDELSTQDDGSASSSLSDSTSNNMMPAIKPLTTAERDQIIRTKCPDYTSITRALAFLHLLTTGESSLSDPEDLVTLSSPHHMAWTWLTHLDDAVLCPPSSEEETIRVLQRYTLALLYYSTQGSEWTKCNSDRANFIEADDEEDYCCFGECHIQQDENRFLSSAHECKWYGIICNDLGVVTSIDNLLSSGNNLQGQIPHELHALLLNDNVEEKVSSGTIVELEGEKMSSTSSPTATSIPHYEDTNNDDTNSSLAEDEITAQMMNPTNNTEITIMDEESSLVKNATDNFEYVDLQSRNRSWTAAVISIVAIGSLASLVLGLYTKKNKQKEEIVTNNKDVVGQEDDMSSIWSTYE